MQKTFRMIPILALVLLALAPLASAQSDPEQRKTRILANLKLSFPQLEKMTITMGDIKPSPYAGLDEGSFMVNNQQNQGFFVTTDDTKLFLVNNQPIDVSRSAEEIQAEVAKREAGKAEEAESRRAELASAVAGDPVRGNPDGKVLIVEFSDFQCPYCTRGAATMEQVLEKYGDDVKFVFKHFPLDFHPWAKPASIAAHCAGQQKPEVFWTLHDEYFKNQKQINPGNVLAKSKEYLGGSGIDMATWSTCAEEQTSAEYKAAAAVVDADMALGQKLGVTGTPGFFVNGHFLSGAQPLNAFEPLIAKAKSEG